MSPSHIPVHSHQDSLPLVLSQLFPFLLFLPYFSIVSNSSFSKVPSVSQDSLSVIIAWNSFGYKSFKAKASVTSPLPLFFENVGREFYLCPDCFKFFMTYHLKMYTPGNLTLQSNSNCRCYALGLV